ncbi:MAG: hypothetical protein DMG07_27640 [Acidobacteria bacterium]|nr:MAG: hypothetical protein DMG07_27640 [Acidobacteriota bacterium]
MTEYRLVVEPRADLDVAATFDWYEKEQAGLGQEFLDELRATYNRVADGPLACQDLRSGIRRALVRCFPYAVYFARWGRRGRRARGASRNSRSGRMAATQGLTIAAAAAPVRAADVRPVYEDWTGVDASVRQLVGQIPWGGHPVLLAKLEAPEQRQQQKDTAAKLGAAIATSLKGLRYGG